jgi:hypothetical protein
MLTGEPDWVDVAIATRAAVGIAMLGPMGHWPCPDGPAEIGSRVSAGWTEMICEAEALALEFVALKLALMIWFPRVTGDQGTDALPPDTDTEGEMLEAVPLTSVSKATEPVNDALVTTAVTVVGAPRRNFDGTRSDIVGAAWTVWICIVSEDAPVLVNPPAPRTGKYVATIV